MNFWNTPPSKPRTSTLAAILVLICGALPIVAGQDGQDRTKDQGTREKIPSDSRVKPVEVDGPLVTFTVETETITVGDRVTLTVRIAKGENVGHVPFHIAHDPSVLRFERGEEGGFLRSDGHDTAFFAAAQTAGDAVVVGLSRLGRDPGANGEGDLCTLEFTAVGAGDAKLAFKRATVRDSTNSVVISAFRPTRLVVR